MTVFPSAATLASKTFADVNGASMTHRAWMDQVGDRLNERFNVMDYGCAGDNSTNDTTNFQAALTAAAGGLCYVPEGTYMVSGLTVPADTTLMLGGGAVLKKRSAATVLTLSSRSSVLGGTIDCNVGSFAGNGIDLSGAVDCRIEGVTIEDGTNASVRGIWATAGSHRLIVDRCRFTTSVYLQNSQNVQFTNNVMVGELALSGTNLYDHATEVIDGLIIEGNYVECTAAVDSVDWFCTIGIFSGATSHIKRVRIANNFFVANGGDRGSPGGPAGCLSVVQTDGAVITGNILYVLDGTAEGLEIATNKSTTCVGNHIDGGGISGKCIQSHDNSDTTITGNTVRNPGLGTTNAAIHVVSDNALGDHRTTVTGNAIALQSSTSGAIGIFVEMNTAGVGAVEDVVIAGNTISGYNHASNGSTAIALRTDGGGAGIYRVNIEGNTIRSHELAIEVGGTIADLMIQNNQATDSGWHFYPSSGSTANMRDQNNSWNYQSAAPSTEYWYAGAIVWNSAPSAGGDPAFMCVTAGNPGTWKAFGNLDA